LANVKKKLLKRGFSCYLKKQIIWAIPTSQGASFCSLRNYLPMDMRPARDSFTKKREIPGVSQTERGVHVRPQCNVINPFSPHEKNGSTSRLCDLRTKTIMSRSGKELWFRTSFSPSKPILR
jgi:hypothetical protein